MNWKAHLVFGAIAGFAVFSLLMGMRAEQALIYSAISGACALLPDLDLRKSKASQLLSLLALALAGAFACYLSWRAGDGLAQAAWNFALLLLALVAADWFLRPRHRTLLHGFAFAIVFSLACFFLFGKEFAIAGLIGYVSHLVSDRMV
ncbi:MAG: metal-dependent hydrolase [Candidatus Micrarchaeota archaeon]|nr:metal-dependent hydrolase [Candidatus Micrarchaeota archaeon]